MQKTVVINAVGLTPRLVGPHTPRLKAFADAGVIRPIGTVIPAVTTTVQSTYITGKWPSQHGIVGNGWYFRDECEVKFWRQSNHLVQGEKIWDAARKLDPTFTCANLFWWYAMYSSADYTVTPRPMYPATGLKLPDVWTNPPSLREELQQSLGTFPLFSFWGPATSIKATQWIADSAIAVDKKYNPTLTLVYLPHLDYSFQKFGSDPEKNATDLQELDAECGKLIDHFEARGANVIVLSEYGITDVTRPVHLNRTLRELGLLTAREELGRELLDAGASKAFAVADHQVAHIYVNDLSKLDAIRKAIEALPGVERVLDEAGKREYHLDHPRAGELVAIASPGSWFTYYYWLDDRRAPDFGRTVDIHRKPGYDPAELFVDPLIKAPKLKIAKTLLKKKLGFRYLMEMIPLDATIVRGSHGRVAATAEDGAIWISKSTDSETTGLLEPTAVFTEILTRLQMI